MSKKFKDENLFSKIIERDNIYKAYKKACKGNGKYKAEAIKFSLNETENINKLIEDLKNETYKFGGYITSTVYEPKERIIDAPLFKDKIVQLAINNVLKTIYNNKFIYDSYACIDNKGTHRCVNRIQNFLKKAKWQYGDEAYIVKIDIKKFFYSIDREILKSILAKTIYCNKTTRLLHKIIDSADTISEKGLPLGNTLSQVCANIYMNELDQYIKRKLSVKYMARYMDDIIIVAENKNKARNTLISIEDYTINKLKLETNKNKTKIFPIKQGVNAIGFKIHTNHRQLRNDSKKKIKARLKKLPNLILSKKLSITKTEQMLNGWLGHANNANSYNFVTSLVDRFDFIYLNEKNLFKINKKKIKQVTK